MVRRTTIDLLLRQLTIAMRFNFECFSLSLSLSLCLVHSGGGQLCIKTGVSAASSSLSFPLHKQALQGFVVGFKGSKIFWWVVQQRNGTKNSKKKKLQKNLRARNTKHERVANAALGV